MNFTVLFWNLFFPDFFQKPFYLTGSVMIETGVHTMTGAWHEYELYCTYCTCSTTIGVWHDYEHTMDMSKNLRFSLNSIVVISDEKVTNNHLYTMLQISLAKHLQNIES